MKTKTIFLLKFMLIFNLVVSQPYYFDVLDTNYSTTNSKMNHLLYNFADSTNTPYSAFYLNNDANTSTTYYTEKISGIGFQPRSQDVFKE